MFIRFTIFCSKGGREKRRPLRPYLQVIPSSLLELELVSFLYQVPTNLSGTYKTRLKRWNSHDGIIFVMNSRDLDSPKWSRIQTIQSKTILMITNFIWKGTKKRLFISDTTTRPINYLQINQHKLIILSEELCYKIEIVGEKILRWSTYQWVTLLRTWSHEHVH